MKLKIFEYDPYLASQESYKNDIILRMKNYERKKKELLRDNASLADFANAYMYFGFHKTNLGWVYREWAPAADNLYLVGDMNGWNMPGIKMKRLKDGVFELYLPMNRQLYHGCKVKTVVEKNGRFFERIPAYATRVVQDKNTALWCAEISDEEYSWKNNEFKPSEKLFIYECHIGMAQEKEDIGSYNEFRINILPRIKALGYNTIQIMAIMEHPYYGSFGYQVSSFYAISSRFGTPNELKALIDEAHSMGIAVLLDVVHSHAVKNLVDGLNMFDTSEYQYFHMGERGHHPAWDTKLFNYGKNEVIHFLLSNLKFYLTEYKFDGFRFDGVTSMLYRNHGLGQNFVTYDDYFSLNTDTEAVTYLQLANELIKEVSPNAITIAEDMSGMPGMCIPIKDSGIGFDYRLSMGVPDMWIKLIKTVSDDNWNMNYLWYELSGRRPMEKNVGYVESHDQALVGDKTVMFRLCDSEMYTSMSDSSNSEVIFRGMSLHKMLRLVTASVAGDAYLNFMGNEFGQPELIDIPREGHGRSSKYCRRQWTLADREDLKYKYLLEFDRSLISLTKENDLYSYKPISVFNDDKAQVMVYTRGDLLFVFNFSPINSYESYPISGIKRGSYLPVITTDDEKFAGQGRIATNYKYSAKKNSDGKYGFDVYIPARCAIVLKKIKSKKRINKA